MFDRTPIKKTALGTPYTYLRNAELTEIDQLNEIITGLNVAFCANCAPVLNGAARSCIQDYIDSAFREVGIRIGDLEGNADRRLEREEDAQEQRLVS